MRSGRMRSLYHNTSWPYWNAHCCHILALYAYNKMLQLLRCHQSRIDIPIRAPIPRVVVGFPVDILARIMRSSAWSQCPPITSHIFLCLSATRATHANLLLNCNDTNVIPDLVHSLHFVCCSVCWPNRTILLQMTHLFVAIRTRMKELYGFCQL